MSRRSSMGSDGGNEESQLADMLGRSLRAHAGRAPGPTPDLDAAARTRAGRIRRRARIRAGIAAVAITGLAVPAAFYVVDKTGPGGADPIAGGDPVVSTTPKAVEPKGESSTPSPEEAEQQKREREKEGKGGGEGEPMPIEPVTVDLDFASMPRSDSPVPYWNAAERTVVGPGAPELPVEEAPMALVRLRDGEGYAVRASGAEPGRVLVVDPTGEKPAGTAGIEAYRLARTTDRSGFAWVSGEGSGKADEESLLVTDFDGKPTAERSVEARSDVVGFVSELDLVINQSDAGDGDRRPVRVDPTGDYSEPLPGMEAFAVSEAGRMVAVGMELTELPNGNQGWCSAVVDANEPAMELWASCDLRPVSFSPDGRWMLTQPTDTEGIGPRSYTVVDMSQPEGSTGGDRALLQIGADWLNRATWSDDGRVVLEANVGGEFALVSCDLDGTCSLVTEPVPFDPPSDVPYVLVEP